jgi:hypothetical protein
LLAVLSLVVCTALPAAAAGPPASAGAAIPLPQLFRQSAPAVVVITQSDAAGHPTSLGSGFFVSPNGVLVTNAHVIAPDPGAVRLSVKLSTGAILNDVRVIHVDPRRDVAVLAVQTTGVPFLRVGDSDAVQVGETVIAIGNPEGLELTMTTGIVEGIRVDPTTGAHFIQHQAPLSHGSSGGPLLDPQGEVIGINSFVVRGAQNLNGAVPINDAKPYFNDGAMMTWTDYARGATASGSAPTIAAPPGPGTAPASPQSPTLTYFVNTDFYRNGSILLRDGFAAGMFDTVAAFEAAASAAGTVDPATAAGFYNCLTRPGDRLGDVRAWMDSVASSAPSGAAPVLRTVLSACGYSLPGSATYFQDATGYSGSDEMFRVGYAAGVFDGASLLAEDGRVDPGQLTTLFRCLSGRGNTQGALRTWVDTVAAGASPDDPLSDVMASICAP